MRVVLQIDVVPIYDFWMRLIARKQIKPRPQCNDQISVEKPPRRTSFPK